MAKTFRCYATVVDWYDADTFHGYVDLGCRVYIGSLTSPARFRCALINAPELHTPEGPSARDYATSIAPPGEYPCTSTGLDNYGRPIIDLITPGGLFSYLMLQSGHAVPYT